MSLVQVYYYMIEKNLFGKLHYELDCSSVFSWSFLSVF